MESLRLNASCGFYYSGLAATLAGCYSGWLDRAKALADGKLENVALNYYSIIPDVHCLFLLPEQLGSDGVLFFGELRVAAGGPVDCAVTAVRAAPAMVSMRGPVKGAAQRQRQITYHLTKQVCLPSSVIWTV